MDHLPEIGSMDLQRAAPTGEGEPEMMTRRRFVYTAAAAGGAFALGGCARGRYADAVEETWRPESTSPLASSALVHELVRCATLAPSSHNTQCWKFRVGADSISILPDFSRRCPVVDPDDHHLFASLGCAVENLVQASGPHGRRAHAAFDPSTSRIDIALESTKAVASPLHEALAVRQSTRAEYDGQALSNEELAVLEAAGSGSGVEVLMLTEQSAMEGVLEYVIEGNTAQMRDPAFIDELKAWIRFSRSEAVETGDGLFSGSSGNPSVPRWLGSMLFDRFFTVEGETEKYVRHVRSSAGIAVFVSEKSDAAGWVEAGRCYERFALQAAALGIRNAHLNQPVEVAALRPQLASFLGVGPRRPDLVIRFGRGPEMPRSLRRPVAAVLT